MVIDSISMTSISSRIFLGLPGPLLARFLGGSALVVQRGKGVSLGKL